MKFIKQTADLAETLSDALEAALTTYDRVIWLIPGGSNIATAVNAMEHIDTDLSKKLILMQTDERYVPLDSPDCNWRQLIGAGFEIKQATAYPILLNDDETMTDAASRYSQTAQKQFTQADFIIGQFGIGADGHTAGIKPDTLATRSKQLVVGYQGEDFKRVTLTFPAISQLQAAYSFVFGDDKKAALLQLRDEDLPLETLPSGILKQIETSLIYNDQID